MSRLARQSFLLLTELPSQLAVFETNFAFEYSESYSGNVIGDCSIEGYQYCVPFHRSFELLMVENYCAFILTIDSNAVCIFSTTDGKYNIFDSHSRDIYGRSHPQGTCVLLEAPNIDNVILYFQSLYSENSQFELRGINIEEVQANFDPNLDNNITFLACADNAVQFHYIQFVILLLSHVLTGIQIQYLQLFTLALLCIITLGYMCLVIYLERLKYVELKYM